MNAFRWSWVVLAGLVVLMVTQFASLAMHFLAAVALSFVAKPWVGWVATRRIASRPLGYTLGACVGLVSIVLSVASLVVLFAPLVQTQLNALASLNAEQLANSWNAALHQVDDYTAWIDLSGTGQANSAYLADQAAQWVRVEDATSLFGGILSSLGNLAVATFSILFMTFFLLQEPTLFRDMVLDVTPSRQKDAIERIMQESGHLLTRYFSGLVLQVLIITLVVGLGLTLLGIPNGWLLGLLAGLFNLIPYVGPIIGMVVGLLVMISTGVDWGSMAWALGMYFAAQMVDNLFTQPVIFAKRVHAHPLEIFVVISIAGTLAGPTGMVLGIPAYTLFRIVIREFFQEFQWVQALTDRLENED